MSKTLLKDIKFKSEVQKFYKENKELILDIVLFGSSVRGKQIPSDIDILVIYKDKVGDIGYELKKNLRAKGYECDITEKSYQGLLSDSFQAREAYLAEGYSLMQDKHISKSFGYDSYILFRYDLQKQSKSFRMRFYYSLYGRGSKGMLEEHDAIKFSDSILLCPINNSEQFKNFLEEWKIKFDMFPILIPERIASLLRKK